MSKHFKTKKRLRYGLIIKYIIIIFLCYLIIRFSLLLIFKIPFLSFTFSTNKIIEYKDYILEHTINEPYNLLKFYNKSNITEENISLVNYIVKNNPLVYIYNSHQTEEYKDINTVLDSSFFFKEELKKYNVDVIVEDTDIPEFMKINNMSYDYSYYASSFFVKDIMDKYKIDLFIDLHRDATPRDSSIITIDKKVYAKVMFVVGGENKKYEANYNLANKINDVINKKYPGLSKGVILKTGKNVNGIYNQDLSNNMILIEIGSHNTTYEEVKNTIILLAPIIGDYLYGI